MLRRNFSFSPIARNETMRPALQFQSHSSSASSSSSYFSGCARPWFARRLHGGGDAAHEAAKNATGIWGAYLRLNANRPVATAIGTSCGLWMLGDFLSQKIEQRLGAAGEGGGHGGGESGGHHGVGGGGGGEDTGKKHIGGNSGSSVPAEKKEQPGIFGIKWKRLLLTALEGSLVGGGLGVYWYSFLDKIVSGRFGLVSGSLSFIAAKLSMEFIIWHPFSLASFWLFLGIFSDGNDLKTIKREMRRDFAPTLFSEYGLWLPIDFLNFKFVPVHLQVIVINGGSLIEAVLLSYVHAHGFPTLTQNTTIAEKKRAVLPARLSKFYDNSFKLPKAMDDIEKRFKQLDAEGKGYVSVERLEADFLSAKSDKQQLLPGLPDAAVSEVAARILVKYAKEIHSASKAEGKQQKSAATTTAVSDTTKNAFVTKDEYIVTKDEYIKFVQNFHSTAFRESFLDAVIFNLIDSDNSGSLQRSEVALFAELLADVNPNVKADQLFDHLDVDHDQSVSLAELRAFLHGDAK